jgi:hypothetical protein
MNWPAIGITVTLLLFAGLLVAQFFIISHGSSGQLNIDTQLFRGVWATLAAVVIGIIGIATYIYTQSFAQRPYVWLFSLAFLSFVISNFAIFLSLHQVHVSRPNTS